MRKKEKDGFKDAWERIFNSVPDKIAVLDKNHRILQVNQAMAQSLGLLPQQCVGLPCYKYVHGLSKPPDFCPHSKTIKDGQQHIEEIHEERLGGDFLVSTTPLLDNDGEIFGTVHVARDITDRKRTEKEIVRLASFPKLNPQPVIEIDLSGRLTYLNNSARKLLPDLKEKGSSHFFLSGWEAVTEIFKKGAEEFNREIQNGTVWFHQSFHFVKDFQRIRIYSRDITSIKKREEELHKNNRILKAINDISLILASSSHESHFLDEVCKIIVRDCGYSFVWVGFAEYDKSRSVRPVAQHGFEEGYLEKLNITWRNVKRGHGPTGTAIRTGKPVICQNMSSDPKFKPWRKEALKRGYASSVALPLEANKQVFGALTIYSAKTDSFSEEEVKMLSILADEISSGMSTVFLRQAHNKAVEELKENEERFKVSIKNSPVTIFVQDRDLRYSWVYNQDKNFGGKSIIDKTDRDLYSAQEAEYLILHKKKVLDTGKGVRIEFKTHHKGRDYFFDIAIEPMHDSGGVITGVRGAVYDISERKQAEEILRRDKETFEKLVKEASQQLIKVNLELVQAKRLSDIGSLAATVAHELRNPLAAIHMAAYNIRKKAQNILIEKNLLNIEKKVAESEQIINNLLFYSRIKPPHYERIEIFDILEECLALAKGRYKGEKVVLHKKIKPLKGVFLDVDPLQVKEVFTNILNNAYDAMLNRQEGKKDIEVTAELKDKGSIKVNIADNGSGISREDLERVFDPFFSTKAKGTGLGLTLCKQIITFHGGVIDISSIEGKGTTVTVKLPLNSELREVPPKKPQPAQ